MAPTWVVPGLFLLSGRSELFYAKCQNAKIIETQQNGKLVTSASSPHSYFHLVFWI